MLQITHIDGVEVLIQQPAYGPHVHPNFAGQLFVYTGILHVQLADGREGYIGEVCPTVECAKLWDSAKSAAAHISCHNGKDRSSTIPVDTLKALLRIAKRFKAAGHRDYAQRTSDEMNRLGIATMDGEPWNALRVGRLFNKWEDKVKAPLPPSRPKIQEDTKVKDVVPAQRAVRREPVKASTVTTVRAGMDPLVRRLITLSEKLDDLGHEYERLVSEVAVQLAESAAKEIDPEILEKAAKWDEIRDKLPTIMDKAVKFDAAQSLFGGGK